MTALRSYVLSLSAELKALTHVCALPTVDYSRPIYPELNRMDAVWTPLPLVANLRLRKRSLRVQYQTYDSAPRYRTPFSEC